MAGDLVALASTWSGLANGSTSTKLTAINALLISGPTVDIDLGIVQGFLKNNGKMPGLLAFVNNTPSSPNPLALQAANYLLAILSGSDGPLLKTASTPGLLAILDNLSADARTGITAGNVTAFNNVCTPKVPWWQANGFDGPIDISDLIAAGNLF